MGSDENSVVDNEMKVHGLDGLRVVDASVMPAIVSGNLNAPTQMMAARAADFILGKSPLPPENARFHFQQPTKPAVRVVKSVESGQADEITP